MLKTAATLLIVECVILAFLFLNVSKNLNWLLGCRYRLHNGNRVSLDEKRRWRLEVVRNSNTPSH